MFELDFAVDCSIREEPYLRHRNVKLTVREAVVIKVDHRCSTEKLVLRFARCNCKANAFAKIEFS